MVTDACAAVGTFAGIAQRPVIVLGEVNPKAHQVVDNAATRVNHKVYAFATVLEMACSQGIFEE